MRAPSLRVSTRRAVFRACKCCEVFVTDSPVARARESTLRSPWHRRSRSSTRLAGGTGLPMRGDWPERATARRAPPGAAGRPERPGRAPEALPRFRAPDDGRVVDRGEVEAVPRCD